MDMIGSLFNMHNIKYVVSVDDCFAEFKDEDIKSVLFSSMKSSMEPFEELLKTSSQSALYDQVVTVQNQGGEIDALLTVLLDQLTQAEINSCMQIDNSSYSIEKDRLVEFLQELKGKGYIDKYLTFGSIFEAEKFDLSSEGMDDGSILWLLDRNFSRVNESSEGGIQLAKNIINRTNQSGNSNYLFIVSAIEADTEETEDELEKKIDLYLSRYCSQNESSFIYYINKQRLFCKKYDRIAKSLSQGFKRKACYELFQVYCNCMNSSVASANAIVCGVRQKTLNYLFANKVGDNGESYADFAARFVQIFQEDEFNKALADFHSVISKKTRYYENLLDLIKDQVGNEKEFTDIIKNFRNIELYNEHINGQHAEITTGDVFEVEGGYYILVSQSCDIYLRADGKRKLKNAVLLRIDRYTDSKNIHHHAYPLSCFLDVENPAVIFQSVMILPFELLDLCTLNDDGVSRIIIDDSDAIKEGLYKFSNNYINRYHVIFDKIKEIDESLDLVDRQINEPNDSMKENAIKAFTKLTEYDPKLKNYTKNDSEITYPIRRLCRVKDMVVADIARDYGSAVSRIGHPFDYFKASISGR